MFRQVVRLSYHMSPDQGGAFRLVLRSDTFFTVDETQGLEQPLIETRDPADVVDADAFEELTGGGIGPPPAMDIDHLAGNPSADVPEEPRRQTNQSDAGSFDTGPTVVIDHFPSDAAGAPIPGIPRGRSIYESRRTALLDLDWAPFQSRRDWEVARWAKSSGVTSAAVSKLFAIPEVCSVFRTIFT